MAKGKPTRRSDLLKRHFKKQGGKCHYCRLPMTMAVNRTDTATLDEVLPRSEGGLRTYRNTVAACWACNTFRGNTPYGEFRAYVAKHGRPKIVHGCEESVKTRLKRGIEKEERRARERAVKEGDGSWNAKPSAYRKYVEDVGKHPVLAEAFAKALED